MIIAHNRLPSNEKCHFGSIAKASFAGLACKMYCTTVIYV